MFYKYLKFDPFALSKRSAKTENVFHTKENPACPTCLSGARSKNNQRFTSSLGPLIRLHSKGDEFSFALLYCAHTANELKDKRFSFTRLHKVDGLQAKKYHTFSEMEFNDLAVAHTVLSREFCSNHLLKSKIKTITSSNIGDSVKIISINNKTHTPISKIKTVNDHSHTDHQISMYDDLIQLDYYAIPGDSGAPVISAENEVIGLIVRTDEEGFSYCNKLSNAKNLLIDLYSNATGQIDLEEIYLIAQ